MRTDAPRASNVNTVQVEMIEDRRAYNSIDDRKNVKCHSNLLNTWPHFSNLPIMQIEIVANNSPIDPKHPCIT